MSKIDDIFSKKEYTRDDLIFLLQVEGDDKSKLFAKSREIKGNTVGNKVYFRGLIEFSNICAKNCLYCGIRLDNKKISRYRLTVDEIVKAAKFAYENKYASIVLQSGELESEDFVSYIEQVLMRIHQETNKELRVTLSCGEQNKETYIRWKLAGAHRYLLRIETSNPILYTRYHPNDERHSYQRRLQCLYDLRDTGYQVGTGVMIGLPFQEISDLADDLMFMKTFCIDMVGMGPFLEHEHTPMFNYRNFLLPLQQRFDLAIKMIAVLRILMPDINIAAATALQAIDPLGREKAIQVGANVIMPNITPGQYRNNYKLYENKPCTDESAEDCTKCLDVRIALTDNEVAYNQYGDSLHYRNPSKI